MEGEELAVPAFQARLVHTLTESQPWANPHYSCMAACGVHIRLRQDACASVPIRHATKQQSGRPASTASILMPAQRLVAESPPAIALLQVTVKGVRPKTVLLKQSIPTGMAERAGKG